MLIGILLTVLAGLAWCGEGIAMQRASCNDEDTRAFYLVSAFAFAVMSVPLLPDWSVLINEGVQRPSALLAVFAPATALNLIGMLMLMVCMRRGSSGITWSVGQSAMVVPFIGSLVIYGDAFGAVGVAGITLILGMIVVLGTAQKMETGHGAARGWRMALALTFLAIGASQLLFTVPSRWTDWADHARIRAPLMGVLNLAFSLVLLFPKPPAISRSVLWWGIAMGAIMTTGQALLFAALDQLGRHGLIAIAYPLAIGTCIAVYVAYSTVILRERLRVCDLFAVAAGIAGMVLISLS